MFMMFVWFYLSVATFAYILLLIKLVGIVNSDMVVGWHYFGGYFREVLIIAIYLMATALLWPQLLAKAVFLKDEDNGGDL